MNHAQNFFLYCAALNYAILFIWSGAFVWAHDWMYRLHSRWFNLSRETFHALHYGGLAIYKIGILLLNVTPLLALYWSK